jgi:hypothetical protein
MSIETELTNIDCNVTNTFEFRKSVIRVLAIIGGSVGTTDPVNITQGTSTVPAGEQSVSFKILTAPVIIHGRTFNMLDTYTITGIDGRPLPEISPTGTGTYQWIAQK